MQPRQPGIAPGQWRPRPPPEGFSSNQALRALERVFLWIPNEQKPGLLGFALLLVRMAVLPLAVVLAPLLVVGSVEPSILRRLQAHPPLWIGISLAVLGLGCLGVVWELGRYSFARRAIDPKRAMFVFTLMSLLFVVATSLSHPFAIPWMATTEILSSVVLFYGLPYRFSLPLLLCSLIVGHPALNFLAPWTLRWLMSSAHLS